MLEKLANADSRLILLGLFIIIFLLVWLSTTAWKRGKEMAGKVSSKKSMGFFSTIVVLLILVIVLLVFAITRFYVSFTSHDLVAIVECYPAQGYGGNTFELVLTRVVGEKHKVPESFIIRGEDWSIGGDILEWQSYMNVFGLKSMYRLTRLQGRYDEAEEEMTQNITAYALVEDEKNAFWEKLYQIAVKLPIIKSAHQNFVSTHPFFGDYFEVYVTPTGYTLERFEGNDGN